MKNLKSLNFGPNNCVRNLLSSDFMVNIIKLTDLIAAHQSAHLLRFGLDDLEGKLLDGALQAVLRK